LQLIDLNNVPLTTGTSYIKWHLPTSTSTTSDNRGRTPSSPIKDHKVIWDYTHIIPIRLTIDKNNHLTECPVHFEVIQEYNSGVAGKVERVTLGQITLNLAEYVEESEVQSEEEEGVVRRYLLQDSKINSTVKIGIGMRQVEGERNFVAPALRSAPVFGGIAGIMKGDNGGEPMEGDDGRKFTISPLFNPRSQDTYKRHPQTSHKPPILKRNPNCKTCIAAHSPPPGKRELEKCPPTNASKIYLPAATAGNTMASALPECPLHRHGSSTKTVLARAQAAKIYHGLDAAIDGQGAKPVR
jgi:hypothetical protein